MNRQVVLLFASMTADARLKIDGESLQALLQNRGVPFIMVDGASPENKEIRSKMFETSGKRGHYPQCFIVDCSNPPAAGTTVSVPMPTDSYSYVGDWDSISTANEANDHNQAFDNLFSGIPRVSKGQPALQGMVMAGGIISTLAVSSSSTGSSDGSSGASEGLPSARSVNSVSSSSSTSVSSPIRSSSTAEGRKSAPPPGGPAPIVASPKPRPPSSLWVEKVSSDGERYYWHRGEKVSSWLDPREAVRAPSDAADAPALWIPATDEETLRPYFYNWRTGESRWVLQ